MKLPTSIAEAHRAFAAGELKPSQLLAECLRRIDRWEPRVQAWTVVDRARAMETAQRLDAFPPDRLAMFPLIGIPIGVKDIFDVQGLPTRAGSSLTSSEPAAHDAACVARLRAAGAIILGKTVTTEFAYIDPAATRNPWDLTHTPGGSSSGSAAAVSLGMCLAAVGSQTGGSIIRPAAYCGVAGFKPSFGRIDRAGVLVSSPALDQVGAMARTAEDLTQLFHVLADQSNLPAPGAEHGTSDPGSAEHGVGERVHGASPAGKHHWFSWRHHRGHKHSADDSGFPARGPRLAIFAQFLPEVSPEVLLVTEVTLGWLESHGAELVEAKVPLDLGNLRTMHRTIMAREIADYHRGQFGQHKAKYGPLISQLIEEGLAIDDARYHAAKDHQRAYHAELTAALTGADAWLLPSAPTTAPGRLDSTGDPRCNFLWSYAGVPAITLPAGVASDNMPVGLQLIAPAGHDEGLLAIAGWCEQTIAFDAEPPLAGEAE